MLAWAVIFAIQAGVVVQSASNSSDPDCLLQEFAGFASPRGCILKKLRSSPLRVIFLDVQYIVQNDIAIAKMNAMGKDYSFWDTCDTASTAMPEWCN
jgi:hypothetical protein